MALKDILVHLDHRPSCAARLDLAVWLAQRHGARLTGLFAQTDPSFTLRGPWRPGEQHLAHATAAEALFRGLLSDTGIAGEWQAVQFGEHDNVVRRAIAAARTADLAVLGQPERGDDGTVPADLVEQVILNAGRPVLVVPFIGRFETVGRHVMIAWNGGRESARALGDALPLMADATQVTVVGLTPAGPEPAAGAAEREQDLLRYLASHGITAMIDHVTLTEIGPVDALLSRAAEQAEDLLVMGAHGHYGHPHLRRGSVTRGILQQMTLPVLMAH